MVARDILYNLMEYAPRLGPEWGSGGIYGLKYYNGVLYYTLAFEALSYFIRSDRVRTYRFEQVGEQPVSGGDTYNAVETVDEYIYFGGWVHAPARYLGRTTSGSRIGFENKYSHVHSYNTVDDEVKLLWKEGLGDKERWVGEVSDIIYDPANDRLLLARGDGYVNLGIYSLDRSSYRVERLSKNPVLKGSYYLDHICFGIHEYPWGLKGIECVDIVENRLVTRRIDDLSRYSIDNDVVYSPCVGVASSLEGRFWLFIKGGVVIGDPVEQDREEPVFIRLFDFVRNSYGPLRTMAKPFGGGILVAYNSYVHSCRNCSGEDYLYNNTIVGPSVLVYIAPPIIRIVGAYGGRITGFERVGDKLVIATNTMPNYGGDDATPIDVGYRGFTIEPMSILQRSPPPVVYRVPGYLVKNNTFGGIPLYGYSDPVLVARVSKENRLCINTYDIELPVYRDTLDTICYDLKTGVNRISLRDYRDSIVSLRLEDIDDKAIVKIALS